MPKITATFSNGYQDTYKGTRDVKAAWMVTLPDGRTMSGHSLDRARAEKTARNNASACAGNAQTLHAGAVPPHYLAWREKIVKKAGFRNVSEYNADIRAKRAAFVESCTIEIVDLAAH